MSPKQSQVLQQWIEKAGHDLLMAEHALTLPKEQCPYEIVCFHAQQAAEKYLKALLILRSIEVPRTHDLTELVGLLPKDITLEVSAHEIASLTPYAVQARYPGAEEDTQNDQEAAEAIRIARRIQEVSIPHFPKT